MTSGSPIFPQNPTAAWSGFKKRFITLQKKIKPRNTLIKQEHMIDIEELDEKYSLEGELGFAQFDDDFVFITVSNKFADAEISLYGAHLTSFRPQHSMDLLWMSPDSYFEVGKAIRGGIPVCFPWFGPHSTDPQKPQHGFGRLTIWDVVSTRSLPSGETEIVLGLSSSEETKTFWPFDFYAEMIFCIGSTLTATLKVENTSQESFAYSCALHSYFNISALDNIALEGLKGVTFFDQLTSKHDIQKEEFLTISAPLTRHYLNTESMVILEDPIFKRQIKIGKSGSKVTTVWNPGEEAAAAIADIPDDAFHAFVCVEATNAFDFPIRLNPGEVFETSVYLSLDTLS